MSAPGYWRDETGGQLAFAMLHYLRGETLSVRDIALIRAYLVQWIGSPVWDANPHLAPQGGAELAQLRELARVLINRESIEAWLDLATDWGLDPL